MREPTAPLGPKQLAWCRERIRTFDLAWRQAEEAKATAAKTYEKLGVQPGATGASLST